jgi:hypothetical protein
LNAAGCGLSGGWAGPRQSRSYWRQRRQTNYGRSAMSDVLHANLAGRPHTFLWPSGQ